MDERSDQDLVTACCQGERDAYAALAQRYSRRILAICYGAVGNLSDAEDLAQETLLKGFAEICRLRASDRFFPWLRQIARNLCTDFFRRRKPNEELVADIPEQPDPKGQINPAHLDLRNAIEHLPESLRTPLLAYYFDGRATRNIAAALAIDEATVHTRLSRARKELRRLLTEKESDQ